MPDADLTTAGTHPFRALWAGGDLEQWIDALAPDVELHSPLLTAPFRGREAAGELYRVLLDRLDDFEITDEFSTGTSYAFLWHADVRGRRIDGADVIRENAHGEIADVTVMIRPLVSIAVFAGDIGPPLAAQRGPLRSVLVRLFNFPLMAVSVLTDAIAPRLVLRREKDRGPNQHTTSRPGG